MALTPYEPTTWVNDSEPDLDATNLNKVEQGIKDAIDGVNGILAALTNQLSTDPDKYAGIAVVNQLNTSLNTLSNTVDTLNSNLALKADASGFVFAVFGGNANTLNQKGLAIYRTIAGCTNCDSDAIMASFFNSTETGMQLLINSSNEFKWRRYWHGTWTSWAK